MYSDDNTNVLFSPSQYEEIENLAGLGYTIKQIALFFKIDFDRLIKEYADEYSEFRLHYDRGMMVTQVSIDTKTIENAKGGSVAAQQLYSRRRKEQEYNLTKERIFGRS